MTDFNYKKYSLENLENWMNDAISCGDATPQEIYDVIVDVVKESYYHHKDQASRANELLGLLNGNGGWTYEEVMKERQYYEQSNMTEQELSQYKVPLSCDKDDPSPECKGAWDDFWEDVDEKHSREYNLREAEYYNKTSELDDEIEEIKKEGGFEWTPESNKDKVKKWLLPVEIDEPTGEYIVSFPDDMLEAANLKEGDQVEWVDQGDGSYLLKKV